LDLYRLLYRPELYELAYERIKSKPGNMTAGSDRKTLDGFSFQVITDLLERLRDESFQFQPARRIFIPKANGKQRPLGIPMVRAYCTSLPEALGMKRGQPVPSRPAEPASVAVPVEVRCSLPGQHTSSGLLRRAFLPPPLHGLL
jgi:hypothetical protein